MKDSIGFPPMDRPRYICKVLGEHSHQTNAINVSHILLVSAYLGPVAIPGWNVPSSVVAWSGYDELAVSEVDVAG